MERPIYWSWSPDDLLRIPVCRTMAAEPFGAVFSLMVEMWFSGEFSLPDEEEELAILSRLGTSKWRRYEKTIRKAFYVEEGRLRSKIIDGAYEHYSTRSEAGKAGAAARWGNDRKVEPNSDTDAEAPDSGGNAKKREDNKKEGKEDNPPSGGKAARFEEFWKAYKSLNGPRTVNKALAEKRFGEALKKGYSADQIISGVLAYEGHLVNLIENRKKTDAREFIPAPEVWLNQCRFIADYSDPDPKAKLQTEPKSGVDYAWRDVPNTNSSGKFAIEGGVVTDKPFDEEAWYRDRNLQRKRA